MATENTEIQASGTDNPLNPVGEKLGLLNQNQLAKLISNRFMGEEPEEEKESAGAEPAPDAAIAESEEAPANEATPETGDAPEETPAEETVLSQENPDDTGDEAPAEDALPKGVQKRIDALTRKRKEAEEALARTQSELAAIREQSEKAAQQTPQATEQTLANPYLHIESEAELAKLQEQARQVRDWAEDNADGAIEGGKEYTAEQIRQIRRNAVRSLEVDLPKQASLVRQKRSFDAEALKTFPWLADRTSPDYQMAQQLLKQAPSLRAFPDIMLVVGDYITGMKARTAPKPPAPAPLPKAKPQPTKAAAPTAKSEGDRTAESARKEFLSKRNPESLAKSLLANGWI